MENALFVGGNTAAGFVGYYPELMRHARRAVILKGGPGVGKSTLMRKAAGRGCVQEAETLLQGVMRIRYSKIWNRQYGEIQLYK